MKQMQDFWSEHPCGTVGSFKDLADHRYKTEPYLIKHLYDICDKLSHNAKVLEIGCGQGTDALLMCSLLSNNVGYYGLDFSTKSVDIADQNKRNAFHWVNYIVYPNSQSVMLVTYNYRMAFDFVYQWE